MSDCFCTKNYQCLECERVEMVKKGRKLARKVAQCGTRAGYNRHLNLGEPTCQECKDAQKEAVQRWQREKQLK